MSPISTFGILALASAVLAVPHGHNHRHIHARDEAPPAYGASTPSTTETAPPYPVTTGGVAHPTGYGTGTGYVKPTGGSHGGKPAETCDPKTASTYIWRDHTSVGPVSTITVSPSPAPSAGSPPAGYPAGSPPAGTEPAGSPPAASPPAAYPSGQEAAVCARDVTVTESVTSTVTVTGGAAPSGGAPSGGAPPSYPSGGDKGAEPSAPALSGTAPPAYSSPSGSAPESSGATGSVSSSPSGAPVPAGSFSSKRGLAYNDPGATTPFAGSAGWAYNWVSNSGGISVPYIPALHDTSSTFTSVWASDAQKAIDAGAKYLFSFNEPDIPSQANLSPEAAAAAWKQYMEPFAGKATLVAPAVTNSGSSGEGLDWLKQFMAACSGCTIGAVNQHWYDTTSNDVSLLQQQVESANSQSGLPVFVGEFGFIGSDSDISSALEQAMSYLEGNDNVLGYAYYMDAEGFLLNGGVPSSYGMTYAGSGAGSGAASSAVSSAVGSVPT